MEVALDASSGQYDFTEDGRPVLRYNYRTVLPDPQLNVAEGNRRYAVARSDYIHPLYGLNGEMLTRDWSRDHPHHRGIYWAWPEVDWRGRRGDLHALQKVFARPMGGCVVKAGPVFAELKADNVWEWEDGTPIVNEEAVIRAYRAGSSGRLLDLEFRFVAVSDPVWIARRETRLYGGLNLRLNTVEGQQITAFTDPPGAEPRRCWSDLSGVFAGAPSLSGVTVLQHEANPEYPGEWVQYPELNWVQPTFPTAGNRYELTHSRPLVLRYRLWIHPGTSIPANEARRAWDAANSRLSPWRET